MTKEQKEINELRATIKNMLENEIATINNLKTLLDMINSLWKQMLWLAGSLILISATFVYHVLSH